MSSEVRVLVVDDQHLVREGIASLLSVQEGLVVVGTASNGLEALERTRSTQPDVVLMDIRMPELDGVQATAQLKLEHPDVQVVMLTTFDDERYVREALQAGAIGYILKNIPSRDLAEAVRSAHRGIYQLDPAAMQKLAQEVRPARTERALEDLTARETEVLKLVALGTTNREIAVRLQVSEGTVKNHVSNILSRLGLRDRTQAAVYASEQGLLE
jgi:DNA-binding NarL/FixJ family response regulator